MFEGASALHTGGSNNAQLFCTNSGFAANFHFSVAIYDPDTTAEQFEVIFRNEATTGSAPSVALGYSAACASSHYCALTESYEAVDLGPRSVGWHVFGATATYTGTSAIDWQVCADSTCNALSSSSFTVGTLELHHDVTDTYADLFQAGPL